MNKKIWILLLTFWATTPAFAHDWALGLDASFNFAWIDGFQQTPKGGSIGSTSPKRPSFDELSLSTHTDFELNAFLFFNHYYLAFSFLPIHLKGDTILSADLTTHDIPLTAGRYFEAKVDDELYTLQAGYQFEICPRWHMIPTLNLYWWNHDYQFQSPPFRSSRKFGASGFGLGLQNDWQLTSHWVLQAIANLTVPATNLDVYQAKLSLGYRFCHSSLVIQPHIDVEWQTVRFKDNQTIPNYLKYSEEPAIGFGITVIFA